MGDAVLSERVEAIKQLLQLFRFERMVYLSVTIISLIVLLASAVSLMIHEHAGTIEITGLFGASGAVTFTTGRLLRMWSEALRVLGAVKESGK